MPQFSLAFLTKIDMTSIQVCKKALTCKVKTRGFHCLSILSSAQAVLGLSLAIDLAQRNPKL